MNYYGARELAESYRTVRKNTIAVAEDIPENNYGFRAAENTRSVTELLVHIAVANRFQHQIHAIERRTSLVGFDFPALMKELHAEEAKVRTKAEVLDLLKTSGESFTAWLETLQDDFLAERVEMPGGPSPVSKSRFEMLLSPKEHEMHHRAQLMLIERMLGIVPHLTRQMQARMADAPKK
jgi:uncharacterized damage-inducible protein DinB